MTYLANTRIGVLRTAALMAADGDDTRYLAQEQPAYADEIAEITRMVWDDGVDPEEAVAAILRRALVRNA